MKKLLCFITCVCLCLALTACGTNGQEDSAVVAVSGEVSVGSAGDTSGETSKDPGPGRYEETYYDEMFDTMCTFVAYTDSESQFHELSDKLQEYLHSYHRAYDIYNDYEGMNNLRTLNLSAGKEPVILDGKVLDLLELGKKAYELSNGKVNIAYGRVLAQWHSTWEVAEDDNVYVLPNEDTLTECAAHCDINDLVIDRKKSTAFLKDADMQLNVGAIGKGYAAQKACEYLRALGVTSAALNMGGTVCTIGTKKENGENWQVGIADPDGNGYIKAVSVANKCVVTSGDYERYYEVEGERYCHLIDPATNYPARTFRSTTVVGDDAGLCDALSTALFLLPLDEGRALIEKTAGVEAFWILADGTTAQSSGFSALLVNDDE